MRQHKIVIVLVGLLATQLVIAQKQDSVKKAYHFSGAISVTNNGVSLVPTFSLGKPATIFNLSVGGERLSFEPDIRFSLEGKPWVFLFWWRYKLVKDQRVTFNVGAHPAINFRTVVSPTDGKTSIAVRRYLAGELAPSYALAKHVSVGVYYLYSRCLETDAASNNHFLALNGSISNIRLGNRFLLKAMPQLYLLLQNGNKGYFAAATITLSARQFPLSLSSIVNKTIQSHIAGSKNWVWSLSLVYSFQRKLIRA
jgi:hypothetical protein